MTTKTYGIDYSKGKVYKIVCNITGLIYVGSTTKEYLSQRLTKHKSDYKSYANGTSTNYMTSYKILENGNYDIILLESVNCNSKDELHTRERYYIELLDCVNKNIPGHKLTNKEYYEKNKDKVKETIKEYYDKNKEKILEYKKEYRINNREILNEKKKEKISCECGSVCRISDIKRHEQSKKHKKYLSEVVEIFV
jgi:hypothetical protein